MSPTSVKTVFSSVSLAVGECRRAFDQALTDLETQNVIARLWSEDHTLWKPEPAEIVNRLGWLASPEMGRPDILRLRTFADSVRTDGYTHALLLGMGGSSLAPEVFRRICGVGEGYLDLAILDSTDPGAVLSAIETRDPAHTLFIVSTKSGGTVETLSLFKFAYNRTEEALGNEVGRHFIAITDPGSSLVDVADQYSFRETFLNDPNIGGRYSALSLFGLVPAALIGADISLVLERARAIAAECRNPDAAQNPGAILGAVIGELARRARDKLTFVLGPDFRRFGDWAEQLIAESTGKEGTGILPVIGETVAEPDLYGNDRVFVHLRPEDDRAHDAPVAALREAGHPVIQLEVRDIYDLGAQFFLWEFATAVAGWRLGINPFDQPDVEAAKVLARAMVASYRKDGRLPEQTPTLTEKGIAVHSQHAARNLNEALTAFLDTAETGAYLALQVYIQPTPETDRALADLRTVLRDRTGLATTIGYGPRFLHSTGQLHKGDGGKGLFIQITSTPTRDVPIPDKAGTSDSSITFGTLKQAQALGDRQALLDAGRRVIRLHLNADVPDTLRYLSESILCM